MRVFSSQKCGELTVEASVIACKSSAFLLSDREDLKIISGSHLCTQLYLSQPSALPGVDLHISKGNFLHYCSPITPGRRLTCTLNTFNRSLITMNNERVR